MRSRSASATMVATYSVFVSVYFAWLRALRMASAWMSFMSVWYREHASVSTSLMSQTVL